MNSQLVADMVSRLSPALREEFEERAAMMEFEGGLLRGHAECFALLDVLNRHPDALLSKHERARSVMR